MKRVNHGSVIPFGKPVLFWTTWPCFLELEPQALSYLEGLPGMQPISLWTGLREPGGGMGLLI